MSLTICLLTLIVYGYIIVNVVVICSVSWLYSTCHGYIAHVMVI